MKILAIGGGEIGRPGTDIETESIDKEAIRLSGKKHPKLLFLPTASGDSEGYSEVVRNYYGKRLGCDVDVLYLIKDKPSKDEARRKILDSDIIYVGGGNTQKMLEIWKEYGLEKVMKEALDKDIVLSGVSAGAICWFDYANSDSLKFDDKDSSLIKIKGLGFVPLMACPHYDAEADRRPSLMKMIKEEGGISIAMQNCSAIEFVDNKYRIITSSKNAKAFRVYRNNGEVIEEEILKDRKYRPTKELL